MLAPDGHGLGGGGAVRIALTTAQFGKVPPDFLGVRISQGRGFGPIDATLPEAMPSAVLLDDYKHGRTSWDKYVPDYLGGLDWGRDRLRHGVAGLVLEAEARGKAGLCFLCYEAAPEHCHRRLFLEWLGAGVLEGYDVEFLPPR